MDTDSSYIGVSVEGQRPLDVPVSLVKDPGTLRVSAMWRMWADHNKRLPQAELNGFGRKWGTLRIVDSPAPLVMVTR